LRALASVGIFAEDDRHKFSLTPLATTLQTNTPGSLRYLAIAILGQDHYLGWGNLLHGVKTGEIAFDHIAGMNLWEYYAQNPEDSQPFNRAMTNFTAIAVDAIISSYDFSGFHTIIDIGGGQGTLLSGILKTNPHLQGMLFDLATVTKEAKLNLQIEGISDRTKVISGNFFESIPQGGDAYLLKHIIHDWDEEQALTILKNCHQAMTEQGKLLIFETVIPPSNEPSFSKLMDINMLVMTGGQERTAEEYQTLLATAGFQLTQIVSTASPLSIIEAIKV